jgi:signal transduction histidine kinase
MNDRDQSTSISGTQAQNLARYVAEIDRLESAIFDAQEDESVEAEAIANQRAAEFYMEWGKNKIAAVYLQDAYDCYARSGADIQAKELACTYPQLLQPIVAKRQKLEEINYFTDEFIATIGYEFRIPLNGILGMSETLLEEVFGTLNAKQLNAVTTIDRSGWYLLASIDNMVDLSKIKVGKLKLEISTVLVSELCDSSITFVRHHAIQKQIQLDTDIPDDAGNINVDFQRMRKVLINLIGHAIDSTPTGGKVKLTVTTDRSSIQFSVIDTSKEISIATTDKFPHTGDLSEHRPATPTSNQKIGFGLMLVNPIVELHGGRLSFHSNIGSGSRVDISLPSHLQTDAWNAGPISNPDDETISEPVVQDVPELPLILIAEDNELNINTIVSYLTAKNYRPTYPRASSRSDFDGYSDARYGRIRCDRMYPQRSKNIFYPHHCPHRTSNGRRSRSRSSGWCE